MEEDPEEKEKPKKSYIRWLPYANFWNRIYQTTQWTLSNKKPLFSFPSFLF